MLATVINKSDYKKTKARLILLKITKLVIWIVQLLIDQKFKHIPCYQLLSFTIPCIKKRPDVESLIIKMTCYNLNGEAMTVFWNIINELHLIINFINKRKYIKGTIFVSIVKKNGLIVLFIITKRYMTN